MIERSTEHSASRRQWETALQAVNDGVCLLGPDGVVTHCNPAASDILARPHDEIIGELIDRVLSSAFGRIHPQRVAYLDKSPRPETVEVERHGRTFRMTIRPVLNEEDALSGSVLTISDTTDRHRLVQEERRAARLRDEASRMTSLDNLKSQFLRLASHELRSPVGVLSGYLSMLTDGSLGELPESARAVMPVVMGKLAEINLLIDQLLDTARLEDSRLALKRERIDLRDVLAAAVQVLQPLAIERHEIVVNVPDHPVTVLGDRARLRIIVTNLIENAIKYSPQGGEVECSAGAWNGQGTVTVRDFGLGIDREHMQMLFTRFGRAMTEENEHIVGTGLGLYLSRELARMHGGDLMAESERGEGSSFTLRLPLA